MERALSYADAVVKGFQKMTAAPLPTPPHSITTPEFDFNFSALSLNSPSTRSSDDTPITPPPMIFARSEPLSPHMQETEETQWACEYRDHKADVILLSKEGVHYRFYSTQLRRHSNLINDLHVLTNSSQVYEKPPIETDCANIPFRIFAHYITHVQAASWTPVICDPDQPTADYLPNIHNLPTHHLIDLLKLSDLLQMSKPFETSILYHLQLRAITDPWTVFVVGCSRRDMVLARGAICHFGIAKHIPANRLHDIKPWEVAGLPMEHLLELMRLRLKGGQIQLQNGVAGRQVEGHVLECWSHVAREFMKRSLLQSPGGEAKAKVQKNSEGAFAWPVTKASGFTIGKGSSPRTRKAGSPRRGRENRGGKAYIGK